MKDSGPVTVSTMAYCVPELSVGLDEKSTVKMLRLVGISPLDLIGGFGISKSAEIERLFRDSRLGRIHPGNSALSHELVGKLALGLDPDGQPRWG